MTTLLTLNLQVWFKNRRAKVRQQSAQGKPIVTNSDSESKTPPKKKTGAGSSGHTRDSLTPPSSLSIKSEARSPLSSVSSAPADSSSSRLGSSLTAPVSYPSPAITPGSSAGDHPGVSGGYSAPVSSVSQFWSPITPPDGIDSISGGSDSSSLLRQPPTLVQMQVKASNVSPPPAAQPSSAYSNYSSSHYSSPYNMTDSLGYFPPAHSMTQPPQYSASHYMSGSNFFRPPSLSSAANTMSDYESYNEKYQVETRIYY